MRNLKIIGYLGSDHGGPEPGAGNNPSALSYGRHASSSSAFHHCRRRIRPWSSSQTKQKAQVSPFLAKGKRGTRPADDAGYAYAF
jgi:hypothetical protein